MVDFLIRFHATQFVDAEVGVDPGDVPVGFGVRQCLRPGLLVRLEPGAPPAKLLFRDIFDDVVAYLACLQDYLIR